MATKLGINYTTMSHYLGQLVIAGKLKRIKQGRKVYYMPAEAPAIEKTPEQLAAEEKAKAEADAILKDVIPNAG